MISAPGGLSITEDWSHNMSDDLFFTQTYSRLSPEEMENYHRAVFMHMDGECAMAKRVEYYRARLRHMGEKVTMGCGVTIVNPQHISVGNGVQIHDRCVLIAHTTKGITLDDGARLKHGVYLDTEGDPEGYIHIGQRVYVGAGSVLHGHKGLEIGDHSLLAQHVVITPTSHTFADPLKTVYSQPCLTRKVTIGQDCYLGMNVSVLWSADIGEGSVVGAGAVVVDSIPSYSVAVGIPAKVIKKRGQSE
ncbi:MAG: acyltransferase [Verrucomicrobia bacterium]|nr:acyltransferase [Verrucomicrobiota bacterium]